MMLVWAKLMPRTEPDELSHTAAFGFGDTDRRITETSWQDVLQELRKRTSALDGGRSVNSVSKASRRVDAAALEKLRGHIFEFIADKSPSESYSERLRQIGVELIPRELRLDPNLVTLLSGVVGDSPLRSIYSAFPYSAQLAVELAARHRVVYQTQDEGLVELIDLLAIAGGLSLSTVGSHPIAFEDQSLLPGLDSDKKRELDRSVYEYAIAIPPFGIRYPARGIPESDITASAGSASGADVLHLSLVRSKAKSLGLIVVADGLLFRTSTADQEFKRTLVMNWGLSAVISLPSNVIGTSKSISQSLLVFRQARPAKADAGVWFIDGRSLWPLLISEMVAVVRAAPSAAAKFERSDEQQFAYATLSEIADNDYSLLTSRYAVSSSIREGRRALDRANTMLLGDLVEFQRWQGASAGSVGEGTQSQTVLAAWEVLTGDIENGQVNKPSKPVSISSENLRRVEKSALKPSDILISTKGKVGVVGMVDERAQINPAEPWLAGQTFVVARLRSNPALKSARFVAAYLNSPSGQEQLKSLAGGAVIPLIQMNDLRRVQIPVPSIEAQQRIESKFNRIAHQRDKIRDLAKEIEVLKHEVFDLFLEEPPKPRSTSSARRSPTRREH